MKPNFEKNIEEVGKHRVLPSEVEQFVPKKKLENKSLGQRGKEGCHGWR